ncbi:hypothetical protein F0U62_34605 [Cystobacter fuscus]|uniref:immunity 26/phosphotriesterase HocA family protein n=1 Tax=Cystobacter fuscus TaxID=43 RepID=UPI002B2E12FC|nr:hypothetical protein F0U62_34605 [Cystobacter fuscus]
MRPTHKPGSFLRIPLADGSFGYGRVLELPFDAFYDYRTTSPDSDLDRIASKPILFRIVVNHPRPKSWEPIGWKEIEERLTQPIVQFRMEVGPLRRCWIFDNLGNSREASPQECIGLEPAAVWESHGVEERLLDSFMGRPNDSLEHLWKELGQ